MSKKKRKGGRGDRRMEDELSRRIGCIVFLLDHFSLHGSWLVQGFLQNKIVRSSGEKARKKGCRGGGDEEWQ